MNLSWVTDLLKNPEVMGTIAGKLHKLGVGYNLDSVASGLMIGSALEPFKNPTLDKDTPGETPSNFDINSFIGGSPLGKMNVPEEWLTGKALLGINPEGETPSNFDINSFISGSLLEPQNLGAFTDIFPW